MDMITLEQHLYSMEVARASEPVHCCKMHKARSLDKNIN